MRYRAKPVVVEAFRIKRTLAGINRAGLCLQLENGDWVTATAGMTARMTPLPGDYWVVQSDGYTYLNPKDIFESKYAPIPEGQ